MWRGGVRLSMSVFLPLSSGGALKSAQPSSSVSTPRSSNRTCRFPRIRLSDKTSRRLSRATPSAASEHQVELIGCPISMSLRHVLRLCLN